MGIQDFIFVPGTRLFSSTLRILVDYFCVLRITHAYLELCCESSGFSLGILKHASGTPCLTQFGVPE